MAISVLFTTGSMSRDQYRVVLDRLEAAGAGAPNGRIYHAAFGSDESLHVFDIWDSEETFAAFGQTLMPILADLGVDPGQPAIAPLENIIQ